MSEITEKPYAKWLEDVLGTLIQGNVKSIAMVVMEEDESVNTFYYKAGARTLTYMAANLQAEATVALCMDNATKIIGAAEDNGGEEGGEKGWRRRS